MSGLSGTALGVTLRVATTTRTFLIFLEFVMGVYVLHGMLAADTTLTPRPSHYVETKEK